jgi:hypothetical protein
MIARGGLQVGIDVGIRSSVLDRVIGERLMETWRPKV